MHGFLIIPTSIIPEWTKQNVPTYQFGRFSSDGSLLLVDDAHTETTYAKWLGPNIGALEAILSAALSVTADEFKALEASQPELWGGAHE